MGSSIDTLKAKLNAFGIPVGGATIREVADNVHRWYEKNGNVSSEAWELVDSYRQLDGANNAKRPMPEKLAKVADVDGLRHYIRREYGRDPGSSLDAIAGWIRRNKNRCLTMLRFFRQKIAELRPIEAAEIAEQERFAAEQARMPQGLPFFITNYSFQFNRMFWAPDFPNAVFDPRSTPLMMRDYRSGTVQDGYVIDLGLLLPGDAVLAMTDRRTGIGSVAHLPFVHDEAKALEMIRQHETTARGGGSVWKGDPPEKRSERASAVTTPYEYELARILREQMRLVPDNAQADLVGALVFAGIGMQDGQEHAAGMVELLIGAAYVLGIPIVDIAIFPPQQASGEQENFVFDNARKAVTAGDRPVATLAGKSDLGKSAIGLMKTTTARMDAMDLHDEARALIDDVLIPIAIGLWGREPRVFAERFNVLLLRLAKTPANEQAKIVLGRKAEWGKIADDPERAFSSVSVDEEQVGGAASDSSGADPDRMVEFEAVVEGTALDSVRLGGAPSGTTTASINAGRIGR